MHTFKWSTFQELTPAELYDILALREAVFNVEQNCSEPDLDYRDQTSLHLQCFENTKLVAYLRVIPVNIAYPEAVSFGRVLTAKSARGQGLAKEMIQRTLLYFKKIQNPYPIKISAQIYLEKFYHTFGFQTVSEPYDEAGISHIKMLRPENYEQN